MIFRARVPVLLSAVALLCQSVVAQASPWKHPDGSTHWYEPVVVTGGIDWSSAHVAAARKGGYLATLTSGAENTFVFGLIDKAQFWSKTGTVWDGPWVGGLQPAGSKEPSGGWKWGELEAFSYQNWLTGKPDNAAKADRIHYGGATSGRVAWWSDGPSTATRAGYVIEYSGATAPRTVGLQRRDAGVFEGYTLYNPRVSQRTFLLDSRGRRVNEWTSQYEAGLPAFILPDGHLVRAGRVQPTSFPGSGFGGILEKFDWSGQRVWSYSYTSTTFCQHHDFEPMPNGNILLVAWELKSRAECIQAGRNPNLLRDGLLWPDKIVEVKPTSTGGTIVWEWHAWDHLIQDYDKTKSNWGTVAQHPELIDINFTRPAGRGGRDWLHVNSISYNPTLDQIMISVPAFGEIWIIDHSTTATQAKGHTGGRSGKGGDLLYRWGNPRAYRAGTASDQKLFSQHDATWIDATSPGGGNILIFNNGRRRTPTEFSSVDEIVPPKPDAKGNYARTGAAWGPTAPRWSYTEAGWFAQNMSSAQRLPNGNTLIASAPTGSLFEVTAAKAKVWEFTNPAGNRVTAMQGDVPQVNDMFLTRRYAPDYPGFRGKNLQPGEPIETYTTALLADGSTLRRRARIGTSVALSLRTPAANSGRFYQVVTSLTAGLIPVDDRFARMGADPLLFQTLTGSIPTVFQGYFGQLDSKGRARATIAIPNIPAFAGIDLYSTFVTVDTTAPSGLNILSNTVVVRIEL